MAYNLGEAVGKIKIDGSGVATGVGQANDALGNLGTKSKFNPEQFGRQMTTGVTLPLVAIGAMALKTAIDFESAFAGVQKTVDGTEQEMNKLREQLLQIARDTPATTTEIAAVAEAAGALGIARDDIADFTELMIGLGEATDVTADQAATSLAQIANIMQLPTSELERFGSTLVDLGNNGASTESQILEMSARLAAAATQTGMTAAEMQALASTMASVGIAAEAGGSAMSRTMLDFELATVVGDSASGSLEQMAKVARVTGEEFSSMTSTGRLQAFISGLQDIEANGGSVIQTLDDMGISELRQRDAILRLVGAGDLLNEQLDIGRAAWEENSALQEEVSKRYGTTESQLKILRNNFFDMVRILGEAFIPLLADLIEGAMPFVQMLGAIATAFGNLPGPVKGLIATFLILLAAVGPIFMIGIRIIKLFKLISLAFQALSAVMALNPFVLVVLAIIAVIAGLVMLYKHSEKFRNFVDSIGRGIASAFGAVVDFFKRIPEMVSGIFNGITDFVEKWINRIREIFSILFSGDFTGISDWMEDSAIVDFFFNIREAGEAVVRFFQNLPGTIVKAVKRVIGAVAGFVKALPGMIVRMITKITKAWIGFMVELPERMAFAIGFMLGMWLRLGIKMWTTIIETGVKVVSAVVSFMAKLPGIVVDFLTKIITMWITFEINLIKKILEIGVKVVTTLIEKFTEFITWLPGFLLSIVTAVINFGVDLVKRIVEVGINFVKGLIDAIVSLPGQVLNLLWQIISGLPGVASEMFKKALDIGKNLVSGLLSGIGDVVGLLKDLFLNALNGIGNLGSMAFDKAKDVGGSIWNGFKSGLGINSPSYVEEAMFSLTDNVAKSINDLARQVREVQALSRSMPGIDGTAPIAPSFVSVSPGGLAAQSAGNSGAASLTVEGPLVGEIHTDASEEDALTWSRRMADLTYKQLEAQGNRSARVNGAFDAVG